MNQLCAEASLSTLDYFSVEWIDSPATDAGLFVADEADGWDYLSYAEFADLARRIGGTLREHGLGPGDNACIVLPTGHHCVAAIYAVWLCGATVTLIAPPTFGDEACYVDEARYVDAAGYVDAVGEILSGADPRTVLTSPELLTTVGKAARLAGLYRRPLALTDALLASAESIGSAVQLADCALLQFRSGWTGAARGVTVGWANLDDNLQAITRKIDWRPGDVSVSWLPLYHDMGLITMLMGVANQGSCYLMRPDQFIREPVRWIRAMTGAQHTASPPFGIDFVARRVRSEDVAGLDLSSWRSIVTGAEPVDLSATGAFSRLLAPAGFEPTALLAA